MTIKQHFELVFAYHFDQLARFMELAEGLSEAEYHQNPGYGHGSVHELLHHILMADRSWRIGIERGARPEPLDPTDFSTLASLQAQRQGEANDWVELLRGAADGFFAEAVTLKSGSGRQLVLARQVIMQHVILHGMQHFAEIAERLSDYDKSPGNIDFIYYAMQA